LRDYLYIPLGGNRGGPSRTYRNLLLTMLLGGLWHGAGAAYVLWGLFHGLLLAAHRAWNQLVHAGREFPDRTHPVKTFLLVVFFFHLTCLGWLLFRAGSHPPEVSPTRFVWQYLQALVTPAAGLHTVARGVVILGAVSLFFQWKHDAMDRFSKWPLAWQVLGMVAGLGAVAAFGIFEGAQFIYFQF
jgi:D-alanyl-lipoteichoic acid acyltransferase DltB (MBOAT superfamily)